MSVVLDFEFGRIEGLEAHAKRVKGERKEEKRKAARRSSQRAAKLDARSSGRGVNSSRARQRVETVGSLALDWRVDEYAWTISEDIRAAFFLAAGDERAYRKDGDRPARFAEHQEFAFTLAGTAYTAHIGKPYLTFGRWMARLCFDGLNCDVFFAISLAQLDALMTYPAMSAPMLSIVPKQERAAASWEPSESARRWTRAMIGAAGYGAYQMAYDLVEQYVIADTSGLFRVVAGDVIEI